MHACLLGSRVCALSVWLFSFCSFASLHVLVHIIPPGFVDSCCFFFLLLSQYSDHLQDLIHYYEERGFFDEIITVLEQGITLDRAGNSFAFVFVFVFVFVFWNGTMRRKTDSLMKSSLCWNRVSLLIVQVNSFAFVFLVVIFFLFSLVGRLPFLSFPLLCFAVLCCPLLSVLPLLSISNSSIQDAYIENRSSGWEGGRGGMAKEMSLIFFSSLLFFCLSSSQVKLMSTLNLAFSIANIANRSSWNTSNSSMHASIFLSSWKLARTMRNGPLASCSWPMMIDMIRSDCLSGQRRKSIQDHNTACHDFVLPSPFHSFSLLPLCLLSLLLAFLFFFSFSFCLGC